jgi:hypothetical protein
MTQLEVSQYVRMSMQRAKLQVTPNSAAPVSRFGSLPLNSPSSPVRSFRKNGPPLPEARQSDERVKLKIYTEHNDRPPTSPRDRPPMSPRDRPSMSPRDRPSMSPRDLPPLSPRSHESTDMFQELLSKPSDTMNDLDLMSRDDFMSTPSMMSTQSFSVATEAEGTKVLSQEEISQLVRSSMQRARQRKASTPRATPRTPSSARSTLTSTLEDDAPPVASPFQEETPQVIVIIEADEDGENSPTHMPAREGTPEAKIIIIGEEDETYPTIMPSESINRKFTWSSEEEQSEEGSTDTDTDTVEGASSTENITPITSSRSTSEDEDTVNCYSKDSERAPDAKEDPAENKVPSIVGTDIVNVNRIVSNPASAITVEQSSKSTEIDRGEPSSVTEEKQSRPSTPPPNSDGEKNSEEPTSEANKEETLIPVEDSVTKAQEHAREEIQGLLDAAKSNTGEIEITTEAGETRQMSEAEINNLFDFAMQKARESTQKEIRELVQASMAAAREEIRDVVRDSINIATPKIEIVEVVKSPKDTPRVASRPMQTSEPPRGISPQRRHLSPRRQSPRRQKQLNENIRQRLQLPAGRHEAFPRSRNSPQSVSTTQNGLSMVSSHKSMEQQDSISLAPDPPDQEPAAGSKPPSPWDLDPSTQFDNGDREKQTKDSSRNPWRIDPSTQFDHGGREKQTKRSEEDDQELYPCVFSTEDENGGERYAVESLIKGRKERMEKMKAKKHLTVETYLPESESDPALLAEEGKRVTPGEILSKAVNHMKNLEKEHTLFLPIGKTGKETSTSQPKAEEAKSLATKRLGAILSTPERTDNPTSSSAFTDYVSSETPKNVPTELLKTPPTEILSLEILPPKASNARQGKLSIEIRSPKASNARPAKLPAEILSPRAANAHQFPDSQWSQNLFTTREEDKVVEQTSLALSPEHSGLTSEDDDSRLEVMRRQRAQLSPRGSKFKKSGEERKLALMRKKPTTGQIPYETSEDDRGGDTRSTSRSASRSATRSGTRSRKGRANRLSKQKQSPKTSIQFVKSSEKLKAPVNSRTSEMVRDEEISRDDATTPRSPSSKGTGRAAVATSPRSPSSKGTGKAALATSPRSPSSGGTGKVPVATSPRSPSSGGTGKTPVATSTKKSSTQSVSSVSLMLSESYSSSDRETVVTEELINKIAALKGSRVTAEELNELLGSATGKARAFKKSSVSQSSLSGWVKSKKMESNLCMDIFDLWPVREEEDEEGQSLATSWLEDIDIPADTYLHYQETLSTSQEQTDLEMDLSLAPEDALSYSFSRGQRSSFTELESGAEHEESVSEGESFSPGWWRT